MAGSETASSSPVRSVIAPRRAGTTILRLLLRGGGAAQRVGLDDPEPHGLGGGDAEPEEEQGEDESDAALDQAHLGRGGCGGRAGGGVVVGAVVATGGAAVATGAAAVGDGCGRGR